MTWDEILALDDHALNLALEDHVYHRTWAMMPWCATASGRVWVLDQDGPPTYATVPHLYTTTDWEACMALAFVHQIGLSPGSPRGWRLQPFAYGRALFATTEAEARRAICRLALWLALNAPSKRKGT